MTRRTFAVGTRGSALAQAQTASVLASLRARHPGLSFEPRHITTHGDVHTDVPLAAMGGQGVFVDAIEEALRRGEVDFAVHSAKDLPSRTPPDLTIAAFLERADPRDVLVSRAGTLQALPAGARIGTSSPRRACLLRARRPDVTIVELRGNVDTRLRRLDGGDYAAIVLAGAGLLRLGLAARVTEWLELEVMLPAPGQGALALESRADDPEVTALLAPLAHLPTAVAVAAERAFLSRLGAGCSAAVAAYATVSRESLRLDAMIGDVAGGIVRGARAGAPAGAVALGAALAEELLAAGGQAFLAGAWEGRNP